MHVELLLSICGNLVLRRRLSIVAWRAKMTNQLHHDVEEGDESIELILTALSSAHAAKNQTSRGYLSNLKYIALRKLRRS